MTLQSPANATLTDAGTTGTITDNDGTPGLSIDDATAAEDAGHLRFPVTLDAASARVVTVRYSTADGTATAGSDYTAANGTLTFTAGSRAQTIAVPVTDDSLDEDDENLAITLQSPANATLTDASATGTITDNDGHSRVVHRRCYGRGGRRTPPLPGDPRRRQRTGGNGCAIRRRTAPRPPAATTPRPTVP